MGSACSGGTREEAQDGATSNQRAPVWFHSFVFFFSIHVVSNPRQSILSISQEFSLPCDYKAFKLIGKDVHTHNTILFKFGLESSSTKLGLPIGKHIMLKFEDETSDEVKETMRPYTPISDENTTGYVELLIKIYEKGKMSKHLESLSINDSILISGPKGRIHYNEPGSILIDESTPNERQITNIKHIGMIAGGTGITPMFQLINKILTNRDNDNTKITLLFANHFIKDVLLRKELEKFADENKEQFNLHLIVSSTDNDDSKDAQEWSHKIGRIDKDMIAQCMPPPGDDCVITICGPPKMVRDFTRKSLPEIGHAKDRILKF